MTGENLNLLSEINQLAFIIWGKEGRALDVSSIEVFEAHLPQSQSHIMEGVGHGPMIERPEESAELVKSFLHGLNHLLVSEE